MSQGLATEPKPDHRHHGFEVVNMDLDGDDLETKHDEGYQMDHEEVETLFKKLDKNNDGRIDVSELAEGLKHLHGSRYKAGQAQVCTKTQLQKYFAGTQLVFFLLIYHIVPMCRFNLKVAKSTQACNLSLKMHPV